MIHGDTLSIVTHQATRLTPSAKLMITYSAKAWWVKSLCKYHLYKKFIVRYY